MKIRPLECLTCFAVVTLLLWGSYTAAEHAVASENGLAVWWGLISACGLIMALLCLIALIVNELENNQ